jgi:hypothetical protein
VLVCPSLRRQAWLCRALVILILTKSSVPSKTWFILTQLTPKSGVPKKSIRESCMVPNEVCDPVVSTLNSTHNFVIILDQKLLNQVSNCESQIANSSFRFDVETQMLCNVKVKILFSHKVITYVLPIRLSY